MKRSLIVVNKSSKFLGTLTDGNIRRNIIKGINLKTKINKIYKKNAIYLLEGRFNEKQVEKILIKQNHIINSCFGSKTHKIFILCSWKTTFEEKSQLLENIKELQCVIMSGGMGRDYYTEVLPKPLIPIKGKPVVDHIIDNF